MRSLKSRLAEAEGELRLMQDLSERQGAILRRAANALKGKPPPLTTWSVHDVGEVAEQVVRENRRLRAQLQWSTRGSGRSPRARKRAAP